MEYKSISLTTPTGVPLALSNKFDNVYYVYDAVEDAVDGKDLLARISRVTRSFTEIKLDRETAKVIRLRAVDLCDNVEYLCVNR